MPRTYEKRTVIERGRFESPMVQPDVRIDPQTPPDWLVEAVAIALYNRWVLKFFKNSKHAIAWGDPRGDDRRKGVKAGFRDDARAAIAAMATEPPEGV